MTYSLREIAELLGVGIKTVAGWVKSGELRAFDCSRRLGSSKQRWRVSQVALEAFQELRGNGPATPKVARRRKPAGVIQFYKEA